MTNETVDDIYEASREQIRGHRAAEILPDVDVTEIASAVYDFLSALRRLMDRPNQKLAISQSEIEVLQFVSQHPGCGVSDIARLRFLRASNVSATVRRLINSGLVLRRANDQDRRAQDLFLSEEGIETAGTWPSCAAVFPPCATCPSPRRASSRTSSGRGRTGRT